MGAIREPSLPRTISVLDRSVTIMCSNVPRPRSTQIDPAANAGEANSMKVIRTVATPRYRSRPTWANSSMVTNSNVPPICELHHDSVRPTNRRSPSRNREA